MLQRNEINHQYRTFVDNHNRWAKDLRDSGTPLENISAAQTEDASWLSRVLTTCRRSLVFITQVTLACTLIVWLRLLMLFRSRRNAPLYAAAKDHVSEFVDQYPFHLYPILAKSMELAFLRDLLRKAIKPGKQVLELAIGEGTLSSRIFAESDQVVGVDISPYSLVKSARMPHVAQAIVGDCLDPPIAPGSFSLLVSNNFLHHITEKDAVIGRWSQLAERLIFNENTTYWASGWAGPFLKSRLGRKAKAEAQAKYIEEYHAQRLLSREELDAIVSEHCRIDQCVSYLSERTFFLCSLFSAIMRCYGPPTPGPAKEFAFGGRLRSWLTRKLTVATARTLLDYDVSQDRSRDVFVSYDCTSKSVDLQATGAAASEQPMACPNCRGALSADHVCSSCQKQFPTIDGMLFLLNSKLDRWEYEYDSEFAEAMVKKEHL